MKPKVGDRVKTIGTVVNTKTFDILPTDKIYTIVRVEYVHPSHLANGRGPYAIYIEILDSIIPFFFDQFEIVRTVGFIIE